jgi:cytochrome o ubiquinol oxidase subunit 3
MTNSISHHVHQTDSKDIFGFWIYILSDCILFATLFASFAVLRTSVYGGPQLSQLFDLNYVFIESVLLLLSSFTFGLATLASYQAKTRLVIIWLIATFLLGSGFVGMEINEFVHLFQEKHGFDTSAALSAFFTLVGTHGLHVFIGLIWMLVLVVQLAVFGLTSFMHKRLTYLGLFWTFLDIVWIFVFTVVYLMEAI